MIKFVFLKQVNMSIIRKEIAAIREDYIKGKLDESDVMADPVQQFEKWFQEALDSEVYEPTAMVLSTVNAQNEPSSRTVLLKDIKPDGFSFYTNYSSRKGQDMADNPHVALLFFWSELQRQVRIEGIVEKLSESESDEYFRSRPRGSQIGAMASPQSQVLANREVLETSVQELTAASEGIPVLDRPTHWGGYLVKPFRIEFWQGRESRLHDRVVYVQAAGQWKVQRLAP